MPVLYRITGALLLFGTLVLGGWGGSFLLGFCGISLVIPFVLFIFFWFGLYFFHSSRPPLPGERDHVVRKIVHWMVWPVMVVLFLGFRGNINPSTVWIWANMAFLAIMMYTLMQLTEKSTQPLILRRVTQFYLGILFILSLAHMKGFFENGRLLSMMIFAGFGIQLALIIFSKRTS